MGAVSVDQRAPIGPLPVGAKLGRYEILGKLAAGGMAIVYVARAHGVAGFERLVAIKVLHANLAHEEEFIKMFLDEARLAASIRHPNVVPTIDISDSEKSGYFLVMEYIEGDHLGQLLSSANKAAERLPVRVTLRVVCDALGGLAAAHDLRDEQGNKQNLVHRDVSPHNIMVGRDGVSRLTDFGVAKAEDRLTHTRDGQVKGKLAYMAPEQAASGTTDSRSDLFSMGVILWECLTGQRLLRAESTAATLHKLLHGEIPAPSAVIPDLAPLDPVLAKALSRDPDLRFQSAEEFQRALEDAASAFGGNASLREVSKVVKHHAAAKLKRDKKLIDDALRALRPADAPEQAVFTDETSSPTLPSSTEISIVAGAANPSLFSKVSSVSAGLANDTMPGNRRAVRRTGDMPVVPEKADQKVAPPPPLGASDAHEVLVRAPDGEPLSLSIDVPLPEPTGAGEEPVTRNLLGPRENAHAIDPADAVTEQPILASSMLIDPALAMDIQSTSSPEPFDAASALSEPPPSKRRMQVAVLAIGIAALAFLGIWASSSPQEVVKVEEIGGPVPAVATTVSTVPDAKSDSRSTLPVATLPASARDEAQDVVHGASPAQEIAPVVPTAASTAVGPRVKSTAGKAVSSSAKQGSRRRREPAKSASAAMAPHLDVIPNPYHD